MSKLNLTLTAAVLVLLAAACAEKGAGQDVPANGDSAADSAIFDAAIPVDLTDEGRGAELEIPADVGPDNLAAPDVLVSDGELVGEDSHELDVGQYPEDQFVPPDVAWQPDDATQPEDAAAAPDQSSPSDVFVPLDSSWPVDTALTDMVGPKDSAPIEEDVYSPPELIPEDLGTQIPPEEQENAEIWLSASVIRKEFFGDHLQVQCRTVNGFGEVVDDLGIYDVLVSADDAVADPDGYIFPTPGTYVATCVDLENDKSAEAEFVVAHEMTAPGVTAMAAEVANQRQLIEEALAAVAADDVEGLEDAVGAMLESRYMMESVEPKLAVIPPGGWPALEEIQEKLEAAADDDDYMALLDSAVGLAAGAVSAVDALAANPNQDTLFAFGDAMEQLDQAIAELEQLEPGAIGLYESMETWQELLESTRHCQSTYGQLLEQLLLDPNQWQDAPEPCPGCFTLVEVVVTMAIGAIQAYTPSYGKILKEAGKAAASMAIMLAIADAIDSKFPPGPGAPEIQYLVPGYGNAVNDGSSITIYGDGFDYYPGHNALIFIGPSFGDVIPDIVDTALTAMKAVKALQNLSNVFEMTNAFKNIFATMKKGIKVMADDVPALLSTGIVPMQASSVQPFLPNTFDYWQQTVSFGALPEVNDGWLPKVGLLIPVSFTRGNGASYKIVILP